MSSIIIQQYSASYQQQVSDLIIRIQRSEFGVPITIEDQPDLQNIHAFYQSNLGNFWMATIDNTVYGTIALVDIGKGRGALRKMFVHKDFRGKEFGLGQMLLHTLLDHAKEKRFKEILLGTTEKFIAAQRFYEKNGFEEIERTSLPKEFPVMAVDVKFYRYWIPGENNSS